jgi:hypothetical protein
VSAGALTEPHGITMTRGASDTALVGVTYWKDETPPRSEVYELTPTGQLTILQKGPAYSHYHDIVCVAGRRDARGSERRRSRAPSHSTVVFSPAAMRRRSRPVALPTGSSVGPIGRRGAARPPSRPVWSSGTGRGGGETRLFLRDGRR